MKRLLLSLVVAVAWAHVALAQVCTSLPNPSSSLYGWQSADAITGLSDGANITAWPDLSGNTNPAYLSWDFAHHTFAGPVYKTGIVNGRPVARFTAATMTSAQPSIASTGFTFVAVVRPASFSTPMEILAGGPGSYGWSINQSTGTQGLSIPYVVGLGNSSTGLNAISFQLVAVTYNGTSGTFYYNGATDGTFSSMQTFAFGQANIGAYSGNVSATALTGDIAQVAQWKAVLGTSDLCTVFQCLAAEYGITLSTSLCGTPTPTITAGGPTLTPTPTITNTPTPTATPTMKPLFMGSVLNNGFYIDYSSDGTAFAAPPGVTNPVFTFPGAGGSGTSTETEAVQLFYWNNAYWAIYEFNDFTGSNAAGLATSTTPGGTWTWVTDITFVSGGGTHTVWGPRVMKDDDGTLVAYATVTDCPGSCAGQNSRTVVVRANSTALTSWGSPTTIDSHIFFPFIMPPSQSPFGAYTIWGNDGTDATSGPLVIKTAASLTGVTYHQERFGNWSGLMNQLAAAFPYLIQKTGSAWRMYVNDNGLSDLFYITDSADGQLTWNPVNNLSQVTITPPDASFHTKSFLLAADIRTNTPTPTNTGGTPTPTPTGANTATATAPTATPTVNTPTATAATPTRTVTTTPPATATGAAQPQCGNVSVSGIEKKNLLSFRQQISSTTNPVQIVPAPAQGNIHVTHLTLDCWPNSSWPTSVLGTYQAGSGELVRTYSLNSSRSGGNDDWGVLPRCVPGSGGLWLGLSDATVTCEATGQYFLQ